jgi:16S rRNA (adenine1518-N6/adenine1519-N6)-dimethyltransferase
MTLMFQKEVADRLVAKPNTKAYGRLSILSQWRTTAKIKMLVPPEAFNPRPKVQSAIVTLNADQKIDHTISPALLERIVKLGFGQRRKMLRSSLKSYNNIEFHIKNIGLLPTLRAEDLSVTDWCYLAKSIAEAEKLTKPY